MQGAAQAAATLPRFSLDFAANCWPAPRNLAVNEVTKTPMELIEKLKADIAAEGGDKPVCAVWRELSPGNFSIVNVIDAAESLRRVRTDASEMLDEMSAEHLLSILERRAGLQSHSQTSGSGGSKKAAEEAVDGVSESASERSPEPVPALALEMLPLSSPDGTPELFAFELVADSFPSKKRAPRKGRRKAAAAGPAPSPEAFALEGELFTGVWPAGGAKN